MSEEHAPNHPSEIKYVKIAAILAVITSAEVGVIYVSSWENIRPQLLGIMMLIKFLMVAGYFMHLKFDSRIFRRLFILGIVLALLVFSVVLWTFTYAIRLPGAAS